MSSSANCELELINMAEKLQFEVYQLHAAANLLRGLREQNSYVGEIKKLKQQVKDWMK